MLINGLKYACSTCIKGHRSSHCSHVDRPLFEIRKKGRPVTQCTFCRDLRKTKQVHIKCACSDKKAASFSSSAAAAAAATTSPQTSFTKPESLVTYNQKQPTLQDDVACQHNQQCTCSPSSYIPSQQFSSLNVTQSPINTQIEVTQQDPKLLAPLCLTQATPQQPVKEESSYSWALITSPSTNQLNLIEDQPIHSQNQSMASLYNNNNNDNLMVDDFTTDSNDNLHLGFIFHKPTSQRFLDGQPRIRRRKSTNTKKQLQHQPMNRLPVNAFMDSILTVDTLTDYSTTSTSTPPSSAVSPPHSSIAVDPMDMQFDYLTEQLEILSSNSNHSGSGSGGSGGGDYMGDLANADELTAILNNLLSTKEDNSNNTIAATTTTTSPTTMVKAAANTTSQTSSVNGSENKSNAANAMMNRSHCGSFAPRSKCCRPVNATSGESVVITITPLKNNSNSDNNTTSLMTMLEEDQPANVMTTTITRIVTCYCGATCTCPGCLVHPGNFLMGSDPYSGSFMNPSSNSSSCYGSDEEGDLAPSLYNTSNNFISF